MRFLLDENLEHEVYHRLVDAGHDVVHVEVGSAPEKGATDAELAAFSRTERRVIATYDDDFRSLPADSYHAVLYLPDQTLSARTIATALDTVSEYYSTTELGGFMTLGKSWLE